MRRVSNTNGTEGGKLRATVTRIAALAATGLLIGSGALPLLAPAGAGADVTAVTNTDPAVFASSFSAQALVPYTSATLQVDDSYAWVHGFFSKGQPESTINAAEYSEIFDPGFVAGAVIFSGSSDPTPLSDPNNFPGYAWASFPVPANQTDIEKCVNPQSMVPTPCTAQSPDQAISKIDPAAPSGSSLVTASGPTGGDVGGSFSSSSQQAITKDHAVAVHADASGHNVSFAAGLLQVSAFKSTADVSSKADGTTTGSASCTVGAMSIMGQVFLAGPGGTIDTSQIQPALDKLNAATGQSYTVNAPTPPVVSKKGSAVEASCQGPAITISHPLPGPLATLNIAQTFVLGAVDVNAGASPNPAGTDNSSGSGALVAGGSGDTGSEPSPASSGVTPGLPTTDASSTATVPSAAPSSTADLSSAGTAATPNPAPAAAGTPSGTGAPASLALRPVGHHAKSWWPFVLTMLTGFTILGSGVGLFGSVGRLAAIWKERVAPIG